MLFYLMVKVKGIDKFSAKSRQLCMTSVNSLELSIDQRPHLKKLNKLLIKFLINEARIPD